MSRRRSFTVSITTPAKFPAAFASARYHESRGELQRIVSPVPSWRSARFGVSRGRTRALAPMGAWNQGFQRWEPRALGQAHQLAFSAAFDEIASRLIGECDAVNAWCSTALRTIRTAHRRGIPAVLEVASAHIEAQAEILRAEHARYGAGIDRAVLTPGVIARTVREYAEADAIIVTSDFVRRTFVERGVAASKVHVVPYGIDPRPLPRGGARGPTPRVLFVGGCSLRKGIPYLLDAWRKLAPDAELRLVGRANAALFERAGGLPARAVATGPKTGAALDAEYAAADIFVLSSVEDGWGLVTNEAMSAGLPVIVTDRCGSAEIVRDDVNGYVVPARDSDALADRIATLLRDGARRRRMGAAARATAESRTWRAYGDERHARVYAPLFGLEVEAAEEAPRALAA